MANREAIETTDNSTPPVGLDPDKLALPIERYLTQRLRREPRWIAGLRDVQWAYSDNYGLIPNISLMFAAGGKTPDYFKTGFYGRRKYHLDLDKLFTEGTDYKSFTGGSDVYTRYLKVTPDHVPPFLTEARLFAGDLTPDTIRWYIQIITIRPSVIINNGRFAGENPTRFTASALLIDPSSLLRVLACQTKDTYEKRRRSLENEIEDRQRQLVQSTQRLEQRLIVIDGLSRKVQGLPHEV